MAVGDHPQNRRKNVGAKRLLVIATAETRVQCSLRPEIFYAKALENRKG